MQEKCFYPLKNDMQIISDEEKTSKFSHGDSRKHKREEFNSFLRMVSQKFDSIMGKIGGHIAEKHM